MKKRHAILLVLVFGFSAAPTYAQVQQRWVARYGGTGDQTAYAAVVDDQGCLYVTGNSRSGTACNMVTTKYSPCGARLWARIWEGADCETVADNPPPTAIALDTSGVYVRGAIKSGSDWNYAVKKYNLADGTEAWSPSAGIYYRSHDDWPVSIALGCGGVYLTGYSWNGADWDYLTVKFNPSTGAYENSITYNAGYADYGWDVVVDSTGVYVTGGSWLVSMDFLTVKYDCGLNQSLWTPQRWDSPAVANPLDFARAIALGCNNLVLVTGECGGNAGEGQDYGTIAYNRTTGAKQWERRYNGPADGDDYSRDVVADATGVYVTGWSKGSGTGLDYATIKYNCSGTDAWGGARRYNYSNQDDQAWAMALCGDAVYVTGRSMGSGTGWDYATIAYALNNGNELWTKRYDGAAHGNDMAYAIAAHCGAGDLRAVYVTGQSWGGSSYDYATVAYGTCPTLPAPTLLSPLNGEATTSCRVTLDWSDVPQACGYIVQVGKSCGSGGSYYTTASERTFDLQQKTTYYWRVRTRNVCGNYGDFSGCFTFTTPTCGPHEPEPWPGPWYIDEAPRPGDTAPRFRPVYEPPLNLSPDQPPEDFCEENNPCGWDEFCYREPCDCDNPIGRCVSRPEICIQVWDPVCGCNGQTYVNECYAAGDGVNIAHYGVCGGGGGCAGGGHVPM